MRFNKISSLLEYVNYLLKKCSQEHAQTNTIYRIANIKELSPNQFKLIIQIIGKATFIISTPQDIAGDDQMLEGFSKKDIRTITYLACEQLKKPKYTIVKQEFCFKLNKILFNLKQRDGNKEIIIKTANQISLDKNILNNLSKEDIHCVSYNAGYEHSYKKDNAEDKYE